MHIDLMGIVDTTLAMVEQINSPHVDLLAAIDEANMHVDLMDGLHEAMMHVDLMGAMDEATQHIDLMSSIDEAMMHIDLMGAIDEAHEHMELVQSAPVETTSYTTIACASGGVLLAIAAGAIVFKKRSSKADDNYISESLL